MHALAAAIFRLALVVPPAVILVMAFVAVVMPERDIAPDAQRSGASAPAMQV